MNRVLVYVEGQTEETFIRDVLSPYLWQRCKVLLISTLARTKRTKSGQTFKGGIVSYHRQVRKDILNLLGDSDAVLVTTMLDYYGLPDDFPDRDTLPDGTPYDRVRHLEEGFKKDIGHCRFLPFLVLHEFEALVLVEPEKLGIVLPQYKDKVQALEKDIASLSPEEINEGHETHPAARIRRYFPGYQKRLHGPRLVQDIGLNRIRGRCPHFDEWLGQLEALCVERE